jgi:imidazolonepropionase-like amidohydrolase
MRRSCCGWRGKIGAVAPGAFADLIVVEGDPLRDLSLLTGPGAAHAGDHARRRFVKMAM